MRNISDYPLSSGSEHIEIPTVVIGHILSFIGWDPSLHYALCLTSKVFKQSVDNEKRWKELWYARYPFSKNMYKKDFPSYKFAFSEMEIYDGRTNKKFKTVPERVTMVSIFQVIVY